MSSKGKKFKKMFKQIKTEEVKVHGCMNPQVIDGSLMCDGDCSMCGYNHVVETIRIFK